MIFFLSKGFGEKCKHTELASNFVQEQYFSLKNKFPFHFSRIGTLWIRKKLLLKFSVFEGTLRPLRTDSAEAAYAIENPR